MSSTKWCDPRRWEVWNAHCERPHQNLGAEPLGCRAIWALNLSRIFWAAFLYLCLSLRLDFVSEKHNFALIVRSLWNVVLEGCHLSVYYFYSYWYFSRLLFFFSWIWAHDYPPECSHNQWGIKICFFYTLGKLVTGIVDNITGGLKIPMYLRNCHLRAFLTKTNSFLRKWILESISS